MSKWSKASEYKASLRAAGHCAWGNSTFPGNLPPIHNRILRPIPPLRCRKLHFGALFFLKKKNKKVLLYIEGRLAVTCETALLVAGFGAEDTVNALEAAG